MKNMIKKVLLPYVLPGILDAIALALIVLCYIRKDDLEWNESFWWIHSIITIMICVSYNLFSRFARPRRKKQKEDAEGQPAEPETDVNDTKTD